MTVSKRTGRLLTGARMQQIVAEQEHSGETVRGFSERRGVAGHSFSWWRKRLRGSPSAAARPVRFALVETGTAEAQDGSDCERLEGFRDHELGAGTSIHRVFFRSDSFRIDDAHGRGLRDLPPVRDEASFRVGACFGLDGTSGEYVCKEPA